MIKNTIKPIQTILIIAFIKLVVIIHQQSVTNTRTNTLFLYLLSSIPKTMLLISQYLDKKLACLIKEKRSFSYKKKDYSTYNCSGKKNITTIFKRVPKNNSGQKKSLLVLSIFMPEFLFHKCLFIVEYIPGNKINTTTLIDTCTTRYGFIDKKFIKIVCQMLEREPQCLT